MNTAGGKDRKLNIIALALAVVHFIVSFFTDRFIFDYAWFDFSSRKIVGFLLRIKIQLV